VEANLGFVDLNGAAVGPSKTVSLTTGQLASLGSINSDTKVKPSAAINGFGKRLQYLLHKDWPRARPLGALGPIKLVARKSKTDFSHIACEIHGFDAGVRLSPRCTKGSLTCPMTPTVADYRHRNPLSLLVPVIECQPVTAEVAGSSLAVPFVFQSIPIGRENI
jgi:hypothetical protein